MNDTHAIQGGMQGGMEGSRPKAEPIVAGSALRRVVTFLFIVIAFLTPLFVVPGFVGISYIGKILVISTLLALTLLTFFLNVLATGELEIPRSKTVLAAVLIPIALVVASLFSTNSLKSFVGNVFEVGTAGSFILLFIAFMVAFFVGGKFGIGRRLLLAIMGSIGISLVWFFGLVILGRIGVTGVSTWPAFLVGTPIDFAILLGAGIILSIYFLSFSQLPKLAKGLLWVFFVLALFAMGSVGFMAGFVILGVLTLMMFVYLVSVSGHTRGAWLSKSYPILVALVFSIVIIISGTSISGVLARTFGVNSLDVRPNTEATLEIIGKQWAVNPVTGYGPNMFAELWNTHKPAEVNQTDFWATTFFSGSSFVLTLAATTGILGLVAFGAFLVFFLKSGLQVLFSSYEDEGRKLLLVSMFVAAVSLWTSAFVYNPGLVPLFVAFLLSGVFAALAARSFGQESKINIFSNPKTNFISVFVVVLLMILTIGSGYIVWNKAVAGILFNKAVTAFNADQNNLEAPAVLIERVARMHNSDSYWRSLAELYLLNVEKIATGIPANSTDIPENTRNALQGSVGAALEASRLATVANPKNYENQVMLGRIYESLATKGIEGAATNAAASYGEAQLLAPNNPAIELALARINALQNNVEGARGHIQKALEFKSNYTNAYFMLAQLEAATNNVPAAIRAIESATLVDPQNAGLYFQLGLVKYQTNDFTGAATAFERAIVLVPDYANARYFLGLAYDRLGRNENAIEQFEIVSAGNPDNTEVSLILENLKAGKDPFTGATPPIDTRPEDRQSPPIEEN